MTTTKSATKSLWAVYCLSDGRLIALRAAHSAAVRIAKKLNAATGAVGLYQVENVKEINGQIY